MMVKDEISQKENKKVKKVAFKKQGTQKKKGVVRRGAELLLKFEYWRGAGKKYITLAFCVVVALINLFLIFQVEGAFARVGHAVVCLLYFAPPVIAFYKEKAGDDQQKLKLVKHAMVYVLMAFLGLTVFFLFFTVVGTTGVVVFSVIGTMFSGLMIGSYLYKRSDLVLKKKAQTPQDIC